MPLSLNQKIIFLNEIKCRKHTIFACFNDSKAKQVGSVGEYQENVLLSPPPPKRQKLTNDTGKMADIKLLKEKLQVRKLKLEIIKLERELSLEHEEIN